MKYDTKKSLVHSNYLKLLYNLINAGTRISLYIISNRLKSYKTGTTSECVSCCGWITLRVGATDLARIQSLILMAKSL